MLQFKKRKRDETQLLLAIYWMILLSYCVLNFDLVIFNTSVQVLIVSHSIASLLRSRAGPRLRSLRQLPRAPTRERPPNFGAKMEIYIYILRYREKN